MQDIILDTEIKLKEQQAALADKIRSSEESLMREKEMYLKVTGAIECISIVQQRILEESPKLPEDTSDSTEACPINFALG
jgi:hypothetical protein